MFPDLQDKCLDLIPQNRSSPGRVEQRGEGSKARLTVRNETEHPLFIQFKSKEKDLENLVL